MGKDVLEVVTDSSTSDSLILKSFDESEATLSWFNHLRRGGSTPETASERTKRLYRPDGFRLVVSVQSKSFGNIRLFQRD